MRGDAFGYVVVVANEGLDGGGGYVVMVVMEGAKTHLGLTPLLLVVENGTTD